MTNIQPCPVDHGGFFNDKGEQEAMARSIKLSEELRIPNCLDEPHAEELMDSCEEDIAGCFPHLEPRTRNYRVAGMVRGAVARVVAHKLAFYAQRTATSLLEGNDAPLLKATQDPGFSVVEQPHAELGTEHFGRVWYGDDARLIALTGLVLQQAMTQAINTTSPMLRHSFEVASERLVSAATQVADHREIDIEARKRDLDFDFSERRKWLQTHIAKQASASVLSTPEAFLTHQVESGTEHISALTLDILRGFTCSPWSPENMDREGFVQAFIAHSHLASISSFMANRVGAEAEYKDRYVKAQGPDKGHYGSQRDPMVFVIPKLQEGFYDIFPNPLSAFAHTSRRLRNKCPGADGLRPHGVVETNLLRKFWGELETKVQGYDTVTAIRLQRFPGAIDTIAVVNAMAASFLIREGLATFGPDEVAKHLKEPHEATSTGAFKLERPAGLEPPIKTRKPTMHTPSV